MKENNVNADREYINSVCGLIKEKATFMKDFWSLGSYFFQKPDGYDEKVIEKKWDANAPKFFEALANGFKNATDFNAESAHNIFEATGTQLELKAGNYMQLFRVILSGQSSGPSIWDMVALLGKNEVVERIEEGLKRFGK